MQYWSVIIQTHYLALGSVSSVMCTKEISDSVTIGDSLCHCRLLGFDLCGKILFNLSGKSRLGIKVLVAS